MPSTYSTNLALELMQTGENAGTWGDITNTNLGTLLEQAVSGYVTQAITDGADTTITIPNGATGVARNMYLELTGTLTAARNLIVPNNKKLYFVFNNTTGGSGFAVTVKTSAGTGISVPNGSKLILVSNGTNVLNATSYGTSSGTVSSVAVSGGTTGLTVTGSPVTTSGTITLAGTLAAANGGTGQTSYAVGDVLFASTTTALSKLAGVATGNALISGGVSTAPSYGKIGLTTHVSGTLPVANGGTGVTTSTGSGNNVLSAAPTFTGNTSFATGTFAGGVETTPVVVTFSATAMTVDCSLSNVFTTTFGTSNVTTAPSLTNPRDGQTINWFITQDSVGSRTMTWPTSFKWPGGTAGVLSTAANSADLLVATYRSATGFWYATLSKAFS